MIRPVRGVALCAVLALPALIVPWRNAWAATLSGIVVDAQEQPAADVPVWLYRRVPPNTLDSVLLATCRTGPEGRFAFDVTDDDLAQLWGEFGFSVYACRPGSALAHFSTADPSLVAWLKLEPPGTVTGRVVDAEGSPIAGAEVAPYSAAGGQEPAVGRGFYGVPHELGKLFAVSTGEDGRFALSVARPGWQVGLRVSASGRGRVSKLATEGEVTLRLAPAGSLNGRIDGAAGPGDFAGLQPSTAARLLEVAASVDVSWAQKLFDDLPEDASEGAAAARGLAAVAVAEALMTPPQERERALLASDGPDQPGEARTSWLP